MHKLALILSGLLFAAQLSTADPRIGSWTLASAQSSLDPPNKLSITTQHGAVHVVISGETHADFTAKLNGSDTAVKTILCLIRSSYRESISTKSRSKRKKMELWWS